MILNSVGQYNECSKNSLVRQNVTVLQMWNIRIITRIRRDSKHQITQSGLNNTATVRLLLRIGHNHKFTDALYRHRLGTAITCNDGCLLCVCMRRSTECDSSKAIPVSYQNRAMYRQRIFSLPRRSINFNFLKQCCYKIITNKDCKYRSGTIYVVDAWL